MFKMSMTSGMIPATRRSTAAVVHAVQPRFDAPPRTNLPTSAQAPQTASTGEILGLASRRSGSDERGAAVAERGRLFERVGNPE